MRWSIIQLIFCRELRDQLRDRRTIFMIAVLPLLLYPVLGMVVMQFAAVATEKPSVIGIAGSEYLPPAVLTSAGWTPLPAAAWLTLTPSAPGLAGGAVDRTLGAAALARTVYQLQDFPPLLVQGQFAARYLANPRDTKNVRVELLRSDDRAPLDAGRVDLILVIPEGFCSSLNVEGRPSLALIYHEKEERGRLATQRLYDVLSRWRAKLREVRLARRGLGTDYLELFQVKDAGQTKQTGDLASDGFVDLLMRIFPFLLVMWSLAGALYPAVDLCAGEKERGTMETLLISPASREEIVAGKFLTIWVFSAVTALLNLAGMCITTTFFSGVLAHGVVSGSAILWCVVLALPLSAFFSAICLSIGAYARSSKEGQYYLMPLFLVTLPLIFLTLVPGVELNPFYSLVPVTGVALLIQRLMTSSLDQVPWLYFVPVLAPMVIYSGLALRWGIEQFQREEVLFREAERIEIGLWLRRLFREKGPLPSAGEAVFCFALIVFLRWFSLGLKGDNSYIIATAVAYLAFVATPPLLMALLITTRPRQGLGLRLPAPQMVLAAVVLAVLLLPPLVQLTVSVLRLFPVLGELLSERQPLVQELRSTEAGAGPAWWFYLLTLAMMPALFEELAFRGFILTGLRQRLRPRMAIVVSSLLFAIYHMNVFQALPAFLIGIVLGFLAVWSGSVLPGMIFHLLYNLVLIGVPLLPRLGYIDDTVPLQNLFTPATSTAFTLLALLFLLRLGRRLPVPVTGSVVRDLVLQPSGDGGS